MFNEFEHKDTSTLIRIKFIREKKDLLNSWEISNFISQFSSFYYKEELLNTIALALNAQIPPENLFIMNQSFTLNNSYTRVGILDLDSITDLKCFYHLGNPISLFPNKYIFIIKLIFKQFRRTNEILYSNNIQRLNKNRLTDFIKNIDSENNKNLFETIQNNALVLLSKNKNISENNYQKCYKSIINLHRDIINEYDEFTRNEIMIKLFKENIEKNKSEALTGKQYKSIEKNYFDIFYKQLEALTRPIVGIYYKDLNKVQILCSSHINKQKRDNRFLDFREISHNSPLTIIIIGGISLLTAVGIQAFILEREETKLKKQLKDGNIKLEELKDRFNLKLKELKQSKSKEINSIKEISNEYNREKMSQMKSNNLDKGNEYINKYKLFIKEVKVEAINQ